MDNSKHLKKIIRIKLKGVHPNTALPHAVALILFSNMGTSKNVKLGTFGPHLRHCFSKPSFLYSAQQFYYFILFFMKATSQMMSFPISSVAVVVEGHFAPHKNKECRRSKTIINLSELFSSWLLRGIIWIYHKTEQ